MARVNVEETAWKKFYQVAEFMKWDVRIASGSILGLWHESQEKTKVVGTRTEICRWSRVFDSDEQDRYIEALLDAELIRALEHEPEYEIAGNADEISSLMKFKQRAKKGGEATKAKWDKECHRLKESREGFKPTSSMAKIEPKPATSELQVGLNAVSARPNSIQFNSVQCSSMQNTTKDSPQSEKSAEPKAMKPEKGREPAKTAAVWEAYCSQYRKRYEGVDPADGKMVRSQMSNFIDKVGAVDAPEIAQFYVQHNHSWYVDKKHDFSFCLADATKLRTEWLTGRQGTRSEAQRADKRQSNVNAFGRLLDKSEAQNGES